MRDEVWRQAHEKYLPKLCEGSKKRVMTTGAAPARRQAWVAGGRDLGYLYAP